MASWIPALSNYYSTKKIKIELDHWSNSQDQDFRQCPLRWYRGHVLRLKTYREKAAFIKGRAFHRAMEEFYKLEPGLRTPKLLLDTYRAEVLANEDSYTNTEDFRADLTIGEKALNTYWMSYFNDPDIPKSLTEYEARVEIPHVKVPFELRIDVLSPDAPEPFIMDFKTGTSPDMEKLETFDLQLYRYVWAAAVLGMPVRKIGYQIIKLPRSVRGEVTVDRQWIYPTKRQVAYAVHDLAMIIEEATRDNLLLFPNYKPDCEWSCDFFQLCFTSKMGGDARAVEEQLFYTGDKPDMIEEDSNDDD